MSTLLEIAAPWLEREWLKHKEDVLWDPEEAKKLAKEEEARVQQNVWNNKQQT